MSAVVLDVGMSIDGFWADENGNSIFPIQEIRAGGLITPLVLRTGAVVMSRTSFDMADDPDWYADNYEYQVPIFVFGDARSAKQPKENGRISFEFLSDFTMAVTAAREVCGERDIMVIGEASAAQSALESGKVDEIYLRLVPRILGKGIRLFDGNAPSGNFRCTSITMTAEAAHLHMTAI